MPKSQRILAIGAHPDDIEVSCGGTLAKMAEEGSEVFSLVITDGSKGSHLVKLSAKKLSLLREKEAKESAGELGVKDVLFLRFKDGEIENTPALRKELVRAIRKIKPEIIFSFDPGNLDFDSPHRFHRDHRVAAQAVFDAAFPASGNISFFPELIGQGYNPYQAKEIWFFGSNKPNKYINIRRTINLKIKSLLLHQSQLEPKIMEKKVRDWAKKFGKSKGYDYAESFRVMKLQ